LHGEQIENSVIINIRDAESFDQGEVGRQRQLAELRLAFVVKNVEMPRAVY
jgi:hypothetical protein